MPDGWSESSIGAHFEFKNGLNKAKAFFGHGTPIINYMDVYRYPWLMSSHVSGKVDVTKNEQQAYSARQHDAFFTRTSETVDEIGMCAVLMEPIENAVFSGFVLRARPLNDNLSSSFVAYALRGRAVRQQIEATATYTTRALTNGKSLSAVIVALPTPKEQQRIGAALKDIDDLIASLDALIAKKRDIKQAAMQQLLTGKTRLAGFEGEWVSQALGGLSKIKTGSKNNQDKSEDGEFPFFVRSATVERISKHSYDCEAILVPGEGGIGSIFHYMFGKFDAHQRVYVINDFNGIDGRFLYYQMAMSFGAYAMQNSVKATVDSLRLPTFQTFEVHMPVSIDEQKSIVGALDAIVDEISALDARRGKIVALKEGMMQQLLTGRIRLV
nr:restriction endonuclease subunit S [Sphingomonas sp. JXJ CY 53]